jgi:hypothetical protein
MLSAGTEYLRERHYMRMIIAAAVVLAGVIAGQEILRGAPDGPTGLAASKPASQAASKPTSNAAAAATLSGSFVWKGKPRETTTIKAVLTPTAADEWNVVYTFTWNGKSMTYFGRMKGSLTSGDLAGEGAPKDKARTFAFKGTAKDGAVNFNHWETTRNRIDQTGTGAWKQD